MLLTLALLVTACGGGDDNGNGNGNGGGEEDKTTAVYHFYLGEAVGGGSKLFASNPRAIVGNVAEVKTESGSSLNIGDLDGNLNPDTYLIPHGKFNNDTVEDIHYPWLVVLNSDGVLYKIDALLSSGTPVAKQLSNKTAIAAICGQDSVTDYTDRNKSVFLFNEGSNSTCLSSSWRAISLGSDQNASVTNANKVIEGIRNAAGQLDSYLVKKGNRVQKVDLSFTQVTDLLQGLSGTPRKLTPNANGVYLFADDNSKNAGAIILYGYDSDANALSNSGDPLHTFGQKWVDYANDLDYLFFDDGDKIYRVNRSGGAVAQLLISGIPGGVRKFALTDKSIVYQDGNDDLHRVDKTALQNVHGTTGHNVSLASAVDAVFTSNNWIFWNTSSGVTNTAHFEKEDGTGHGMYSGNSSVNTFGAAWARVARKTTRSDEIGSEKGALWLYSASSDSTTSLYLNPLGATSLASTVLDLESTVDVINNVVMNTYEGSYALVSVLGATGETYAVDGAKTESMRIDSVDDTSDNAFELISP